MAGHSKWANIQHRKRAQDSKRGKLFTRLIRQVTTAAREGGADPDGNPALRLALEKANAGNVPKDTIERAVKKASGDLDGVVYEALRYEGYAPGGVALIVDCVTDNRNRTAGEVRHAFTKHGGNLGTDGSVAYLFNKIGVLAFAPGSDEDQIMEAALEGGADDVSTEDDGSIEVITQSEDFLNVVTAIRDAGIEVVDSAVTMRAGLSIALDIEAAQKLLKLVDRLEDLDDTQDVYHNAEIPTEAYE